MKCVLEEYVHLKNQWQRKIMITTMIQEFQIINKLKYRSCKNDSIIKSSTADTLFVIIEYRK